MTGPCNHRWWSWCQVGCGPFCLDCGITWERAMQLQWEPRPIKLKEGEMLLTISVNPVTGKLAVIEDRRGPE